VQPLPYTLYERFLRTEALASRRTSVFERPIASTEADLSSLPVWSPACSAVYESVIRFTAVAKQG